MVNWQLYRALAIWVALTGCTGAPDTEGSPVPPSGGIGGIAATAAGLGGMGAAGTVAPTAGAAGPPTGGSAGQGMSEAGSAGHAGMLDASVDAAADGSLGDGDAGMLPDDDRCDVAVLDPANPPALLTLSGDLGTHDPALIEQDGVFYLYQTGPRLPGKRSTDLRNWQGTGSALGMQNPAWVAREVPGASDLWAPDLSFFGGQYHLYYSASTFGSRSSCIGHAVRASMSSGSFSDQGPVLCSNHGSNDNWNAIDPNVFVDIDGKAYLLFGSFWEGIKAIELDASGARSGDTLHSLAWRPASVEGAVEAPFLVRRCGYYYLFVSFDKCCQGASSTYNMRVGRSESALGPYVDKSGQNMLDGGGTLLVESGGSWRGPGHNAVIFVGDKAYNVFHAYHFTNGAPTLQAAELVWDAEGWPVSGGP